MVFDIHTHIGWHLKYGSDASFYYSPEMVCRWAEKSGITHFAYSSLSTPKFLKFRDCGFLLEEREKMAEFSRGRAFFFQWVNPEMLETGRGLERYLNCECRDGGIRGLKIHGYLQVWDPFGRPLRRVFSIAQERGLPVLFHTGNKEPIPKNGYSSEAGEYLQICREFPDVRVILGHARPIGQAIAVMRECENVYADTAFLPDEHLELLLENNFSHRVLFGTDLPICKRFYKCSCIAYTKAELRAHGTVCGSNACWLRVSGENARSVFKRR